MKKFAKIKFWSLLVFGVLLILLGSFFFVTKKSSLETARILMMAGAVQLIIFYGLLFYLYKGKLKDTLKK